jgi:hypothetical protein
MTAKKFTLGIGYFVMCFYCSLVFAGPEVVATVEQPKSRYAYPKIGFHLKEFPQDQEIICSIERPILHKKEQLSRFRVNEAGKLDGTESGALEMVAQGYLRGEQITVTFCTQDGTTIASTSVIPSPISHTIPEKNLTLSAELTGTFPIAHYNLQISGLQDGEKFTFRTKSGEERLEHEVTYHKPMGFGYSPDILNGLGGIGEVSIITTRGTLSLQLPWGYRLFDVAETTKH